MNFLSKIKNKIFYALVCFSLPISNVSAQGWIACAEPPDCKFEEIIQTVNNLIAFVLQIAIAFTAISFAYAGFLYLTAQGDSGKISKAHGIFKKTVIGILIVLSAYLIVKLITSSLGLESGYVKYE